MGGCLAKPSTDGGVTTPEPLSTQQLLHVRARLQSQKQLTEELQACFNLALSEFPQEPLCIQENARMTIQSGTAVLVFTSGTQENEISIFDVNGQVKYNVQTVRWDSSVARVITRNIVKPMVEMVNYTPTALVLGMMRMKGQ